MGKAKKLTDDELLNQEFNFENSVRIEGPLTSAKLKQARAEIKTNKILKTVRYDSALLDQIKSIAERDGIPYQTLMNILLRKGLAYHGGPDLVERVEKLEQQMKSKNGRTG